MNVIANCFFSVTFNAIAKQSTLQTMDHETQLFWKMLCQSGGGVIKTYFPPRKGMFRSDMKFYIK